MKFEPKIVFIQDNLTTENIFLGIVPLGSSSETIITVKNVGKIDITKIDFTSEHQDVKINADKSKLKIDESLLLKLNYTPKIQVDEGINAKIKVDMEVIV